MNKKIRLGLMLLCFAAFTLAAGSCIPHIHGNGKVVKEERNVSGFEALDVSNGIEVLVAQDSFEKVTVEVDENILKMLKTEVSGGKLKIYLEESILHAKSLKVYVTMKQLKSVETSSGSEVKSTAKINVEKLKLNSSSGSSITMEVTAIHLSAESSSGSDIKISGAAQDFKGDSSSGSGIHASNLVAEKGNLSASSGSSIHVQVTKDVRAHASSGAGINVGGNPEIRDTDSSSGGSVHFK